jgi:peptide chain release factor subunit 1
MYKSGSSYGIVIVTGEKSLCYNLTRTGKHSQVDLLNDTTTMLQKRQKKGGQSAQRIGRIRQEKEDAYIKKVSEMIVETYFKNNNTECIIKGIVFAGPAQLKSKVSNHPIITQFFGNLILKVVDTSELDDSTVWDVYEKCLEEFSTSDDQELLELISEIKDLITNCSDKLLFGEKEVLYDLENCMIEKLLVSSDIDPCLMQRINELNIYECKIIESEPSKFKSIGADIVGIRFY